MDENTVLSPIKVCRVDPGHDHWVYECPEVRAAVRCYGSLMEARGVLAVTQKTRVCRSKKGPFRCQTCRACLALNKAADDVARLEEEAQGYASSGDPWEQPRTPPPGGRKCGVCGQYPCVCGPIMG